MHVLRDDFDAAAVKGDMKMGAISTNLLCVLMSGRENNWRRVGDEKIVGEGLWGIGDGESTVFSWFLLFPLVPSVLD
jgi:hypothetical protein